MPKHLTCELAYFGNEDYFVSKSVIQIKTHHFPREVKTMGHELQRWLQNSFNYGNYCRYKIEFNGPPAFIYRFFVDLALLSLY